MAIQTQDFYANGLPTGIQANAGIVYTNLWDGMQYKQKTIPFGTNWVSLGTKAYFYYQSSGSLPSQTGKAGKYLKTDGTTASWEDGATGITSVTATSPVASTGGTTPVISMPRATGSQSGYLYSVDWATFNAKQDAITKGNLTEATSSVLTITGGTASVIGLGVSIQVKQASSLQGGYLSSADWTTFNNKGSGTVTSVSGTAPIVSSGGNTPAISIPKATSSADGYLSSTDWNTFNNKSKITSGTTEIDFGLAPGGNYATTTISLATVTTTSIINVYMMSEATATHNAYEHSIVPIKLTAGNIVNGVSFDIIAVTEWRLTGTFKIKYTIQ